MTDNAQRRVLVLNGNGNNLGDQAIFAGWLRVFGDAVDAAGLDVIVDQSFIYDLPFREETIATINQSYDLLVMGGGGFLYHRGADKSASGWGFDIPEELIPSLEVPFAIYSTGYNYRAFAPEHFPAHTASHVRATVKHAAHFSVREHGSVKKLEEAFGVTEGVSFVPDCALHVEPARVHLPRLDPSRKSLGLCLRIDRPEERFPAPFSQSFERYIQTLVETCKQLVEEDGYQIVFTPHLLTAGDLEVGRLLRASLPEDALLLLHEEVPAIYQGADLLHPGLLAGVYEKLHLVLGQRLHSVILPWAMGTPVVSLSTTRSNGWMQEEFGSPKSQHIDLFDFDRECRTERFVSAVREASAQRDALSAQAKTRKAELVQIAQRETRALVGATLGQLRVKQSPFLAEVAAR
ncbi:MAG: polysaccharide pyruvyl transferase family protein [Sandaracinaceae bacterium]